jgi:predicted nucleic acid-binding protein
VPDELVVDTNVLSFVLKGSRDAARYLPHLGSNVMHVSFMTLAELDRWILRSNWGTDRRMTYERIVSDLVVLPSNRELGRIWASVMVTSVRLGRPMSIADAWIAATALLLDLPLVTDNQRDFESVPGLRIIHEPRLA